MRRLAALATGIAALTACEIVVGIKDKTTEADPAVPCADQPPYLFCEDFDEDGDAGATWEWDTPKGGATIESTTAESQTPPRSVAIANPPSSDASAQLGEPVGGLAQGFRLAFDLFVDEADFTSLPQVGVAQVLASGNSTQLDYVLGPGNTCQVQLWQSQTQLLTPTIPCPPLRTWTRVVLAYDKDEGLTVVEDDVTLFSSGPTTLGPPGDTTIIVGAVYVNPPGSIPFQADIDTVVMRGQ